MRRSAPIVWLLLGASLALAPLALASPPDPLWICGIFDAGDTDDVLVAATSVLGTPPTPTLDRAAAFLAPAGGVAPGDAAIPASSPLSIRQGRSPPAP